MKISRIINHELRTAPFATENGRSMIEMIGVIAISAVMLAAAFAAYSVVKTRMTRTAALSELRDDANNIKLLYSGRGNYAGISVAELIRSGAMKSERAPAIASALDVASEYDDTVADKMFSIKLSGVSYNDCVWIAGQKLDFATAIWVNDLRDGDMASYCRDGTNDISIVGE